MANSEFAFSFVDGVAVARCRRKAGWGAPGVPIPVAPLPGVTVTGPLFKAIADIGTCQLCQKPEAPLVAEGSESAPRFLARPYLHPGCHAQIRQHASRWPGVANSHVVRPGYQQALTGSANAKREQDEELLASFRRHLGFDTPPEKPSWAPQ